MIAMLISEAAPYRNPFTLDKRWWRQWYRPHDEWAIVPRMRFVRSAGVALLAAVVATILAVVAQMLAGYAYVWGQISGDSGGLGAYESEVASLRQRVQARTSKREGR
jgi:ABC-type glycerol-3-phosphate transport system permease component